MSLKHSTPTPTLTLASSSASLPCVKPSLKLHVFNSDTTKVNVCRPSLHSSRSQPVQPSSSRSSLNFNNTTLKPGLVRPM